MSLACSSQEQTARTSLVRKHSIGSTAKRLVWTPGSTIRCPYLAYKLQNRYRSRYIDNMTKVRFLHTRHQLPVSAFLEPEFL